MLYWLSNSKVRLGLLVNVLYLMSLFFPSPSQVGGRPYPNYYERPDSATTKRAPVSVYLPPPTGPTKATSYRDKYSSELTVYLEQDLTLRATPNQRLLLAPLFNVPADDSPDSVLLRFISFSEAEALAADNSLLITADGRQVWPAYGPDGETDWDGWKEQVVPPHVTREEDGSVVENVGKTIPYEVFAEVVGAEHVVFILGPYLVTLNEEQLDALRDMHRLWAHPTEKRDGDFNVKGEQIISGKPALQPPARR